MKKTIIIIIIAIGIILLSMNYGEITPLLHRANPQVPVDINETGRTVTLTESGQIVLTATCKGGVQWDEKKHSHYIIIANNERIYFKENFVDQKYVEPKPKQWGDNDSK